MGTNGLSFLSSGMSPYYHDNDGERHGVWRSRMDGDIVIFITTRRQPLTIIGQERFPATPSWSHGNNKKWINIRWESPFTEDTGIMKDQPTVHSEEPVHIRPAVLWNLGFHPNSITYVERAWSPLLHAHQCGEELRHPYAGFTIVIASQGKEHSHVNTHLYLQILYSALTSLHLPTITLVTEDNYIIASLREERHDDVEAGR
jgi:hypothetical protein